MFLVVLVEEKGWWRGQLLRWAWAAARLTEDFMVMGAILAQLQGAHEQVQARMNDFAISLLLRQSVLRIELERAITAEWGVTDTVYAVHSGRSSTNTEFYSDSINRDHAQSVLLV